MIAFSCGSKRTGDRGLAGGIPALAILLATLSPLAAKGAPADVSAEVREQIEQALPTQACVPPQKLRKLLIFDLNVGYGGHGSIAAANHAFARMGEKTGAFQTVVSRDPKVFEPENLRQFDAVFFNNNVGNLFQDPRRRQSLIEFVYGGGGLLGVHGTTVAFTRWEEGAIEDWPEFGIMLGGRGANHRAQDEHIFIKRDEPSHPLVRAFGQDFDYRSEFFRVHDPYSRDRVRVLLSIDTARSGLTNEPRDGSFREDGDYALAWIRRYGRGRVFYSTIAHGSSIFWDPQMLQFYLAAVQFATGDLDAPAAPSNRLTPAFRAQEQLGWRLGIEAYTFHKYTLFEAIDKTSQLGLPYIGGLSFQKVSSEIPKNFDPQLSDEELRQVRLKLDAAGVRMLTYYIQDIPGDAAQCRRVFEFGRKIGIETFMTEPAPEALDTIERFCDEYDICVALHNHDQQASPVYWNPDGILKVCQGRSRRIGACGDVGYWVRAGIDPVQAVRTLGDRLIALQMHDLHERNAQGHDVPWGSGAVNVEQLLAEIHRLGIQPVMFGLEYSYNWTESLPEIAQCVEFFNRISLKLATGDAP